MFIPNAFGMWSSFAGNNKFGEPQWSQAVRIPCASVEIIPSLQRSPIRSDASASHAASDELDVDAIVLIPANYPIAIGDRFDMDGSEMRVISVQSQNNVLTGKTDHYQISLEAVQE